MTSLREVTEKAELAALEVVARALAEKSSPRAALRNIVARGSRDAVAVVNVAMDEAHRSTGRGARPGPHFYRLREQTRRKVERAFMAVLSDSANLHDRLARKLRPAGYELADLQRDLDRAANAREGGRVNVNGRVWTLTTYLHVVRGSAVKRAQIFGVIDRG